MEHEFLPQYAEFQPDENFNAAEVYPPMKYHDCNVISLYRDSLSSLESFNADPKDVIISTSPRSGTTWTSAIVHMIQNDGDPACLNNQQLVASIPFMEWTAPGIEDGKRCIDIMKSRPPPRTMYTHLWFDALPESIKQTAKVICVERNPKDVMVSWYHFCISLPKFPFRGSLDSLAETYFNGTSEYGPYFQHVASSWKNRNRPNVFFMTYESLVKNFESNVRNLARFLGKELTQEQLMNISFNCNFDAMKKNHNTNRQAFEDVGFFDFKIAPFIRAGKVGGWKKHLSVDLNNRVDQWIEEERERLKEDLDGFEFEFE